MVEARRGGGAKEAQQWTEGSETSVKKISRNCKKKIQKTQKQTEK
jgi:ribosome recycling factor